MNGANVTAGTFNIHARTDGGNKVYITAYKSGLQNTSLTLDSQLQQVTVEQGTFRVAGNTVLAGATATTLNVTGALTAQTVTPANWTNHDVRYMTGIPTNMQGNSLSAAVVTEKNDVLSVNGNLIDGPYGDNTYVGQVVNYRRTSNASNSITQFFLDGTAFHIRTGSGSPGAWSWTGGGANGWRKVYDESHKPTPAEIGALKNTTDTMNGELGVLVMFL
ncbi:long tail fiber protein distal subunit [Citrobacter phage IME-CF2]|uniref:Long tail fiber protein n=1 Tax=Citrobacter phage IME-CF2 TaxID=1673887 RepID=A0A0K0QSE1_9CAUD|nr:long tail fiber protein distal subunit [Citrobacter phage IME-CF2]AKR16046.1 long tail fiber protein [Citrobacter phage IME-CF2]